MRTRIIFVGLIVSIVLSTLARPSAARVQAAPPFPDQRDAVKQAVYWMVRTFQNDDGGYASFSSGANEAPSTVPGTLDAILALSAAGYNPTAIFPGEPAAPIDFLIFNEGPLVEFAAADGAQAGKVVLALTAATIDPRAFQGHDYVADLTSHLEASGAYGVADAFKQAVAILGVVAAGETVPESAITWLEDLQTDNGSWDDGFGTLSSADATAMAVMALLAAEREKDSPSVAAAVDFLAASQLPDGWEYGPGLGASANSTALVVQALSALGEDWYSAGGAWSVNGVSPREALLDYQNTTGAFQSDFGQGPFDDFYATVQAIPAAAGRPFPLPVRLEAARAALDCLDTLQDPTSGGWPQFAGNPVDAAGTSRAIQAIAALGEDPQAARWTTAGGVDAVEALEALASNYLAGGRGGRVGIVMQGVVAAGPPHTVADFAGADLTALMAGHLEPNGAYDSTDFGIFAHAEALLGLLAAGEPVAPAAVDLLLASQTGGDWGEPDQNGIALQVLGELGRPARASTLAALRASQNVEAGWGFAGATSASTSSEVVQGLIAAGQNPYGPQWSRVVNGRLTNAADAVLAQQGENGCWPNAFGPGDDPYSTTDAILLLTGRAGWGFSTVFAPAVMSE
jgi:hypothetical protein